MKSVIAAAVLAVFASSAMADLTCRPLGGGAYACGQTGQSGHTYCQPLVTNHFSLDRFCEEFNE